MELLDSIESSESDDSQYSTYSNESMASIESIAIEPVESSEPVEDPLSGKKSNQQMDAASEVGKQCGKHTWQTDLVNESGKLNWRMDPAINRTTNHRRY